MLYNNDMFIKIETGDGKTIVDTIGRDIVIERLKEKEEKEYDEMDDEELADEIEKNGIYYIGYVVIKEAEDGKYKIFAEWNIGWGNSGNWGWLEDYPEFVFEVWEKNPKNVGFSVYIDEKEYEDSELTDAIKKKIIEAIKNDNTFDDDKITKETMEKIKEMIEKLKEQE